MKYSRLLALGLIATLGFACTPKESEDDTADTPSVTPVFSTGQNASIALGQPDLTTGTSGSTSSTLDAPTSVAVSGGKIVITDFLNSRVVGYNSVPTASGTSFDIVMGVIQGTGADEFLNPTGIYLDSTRMIVSDTSNDRVQIFPTPIVSSMSATIAIGQANPATANAPSVTAQDVNSPSGVAVTPGGKIVVVDQGYHRILIYNSIPTSSDPAPSLVLGQVDLNNGASRAASTTTGMNLPTGVWTDGTKLVVSIGNHHRVLIWNTFPTTNNQQADLVLGQPDMTSGTMNNGGLTASTMYQPSGIVSDGTQLFISDNGNHRVLVWNTWPTTNGQAADMVLGQADFTTDTSGTTAAKLDGPAGLAYDGTQLFVADSGNNRVLIFKKQ